MEFRLLGPLEVVDGDRLVDLGARKQRALLCLLLLHANRVVTTDRILDELWGEDAAGKENALWVAISRLRSALEPERDAHGDSSVLRTRDHGYVLQVDPQRIDLVQFDTGVEQTRRLLHRDPGAAAERIEAVLRQWRGSPLAEFQHEEFAQLEIGRLNELRLEALELRAEAFLRLGRAREQVAALDTLHREHPLRERFVELLMRSLYHSGRHADALRAFDRYRRAIGEELGIEPSPELRRLEEQILLHDPSVQPDRRTVADDESSEAVNPFKGLRSFGEDDAGDFFGRDRLICDVVRRIEAGQRLVALVGASGSGKSSVVRAGVVPAVRKGVIDQSEHWLIAQMVPGSRPILELEAALLRSTLDAPDSLIEQLTESDTGLLRAALRLLPHNARLLLVVDQFEELFTLVDEAERKAFLDLLGPALDDSHGRVTVVITLRADFYDRPLVYPDFARRLGEGIVNVSPLTPDELELAVREPIRPVNVAIEPSLLAALLTDVIGQPGALPLFQYTLTLLFDRREADVLPLDAYRAIGGIKGALGQRAEDLWSRLTDCEGEAARQLFLRLVTISGDREWSRRRVVATELTSLRTDLVATQRVIQLFGEHRLLSFDRDHVSGSPTTEVAHEALLTEWPRLTEWIQQARDDVVRHHAFVAAMNEWHDAGCNVGYLLAGQRLADYEAWEQQAQLVLTDDERDFLERSIRLRDDADRGESERHDREVVLARRVRRRNIGLLVALLLIIGGGTAIWFATRADDVPSIAYVHPSNPGGDVNVPLQLFAGWEQAQREHDFEPVDLQPLTDPADELAALAATKPDLVLVNSDFAGAVPELAPRYPDVQFVTLENFPQDYGLPNVTTISTVGDAPGSFLAGAAAALTSTTGTIGFLGGHMPVTEPFRGGFEAGARAVDPDIEIISTYLLQSGYYDVFNAPDAGAAAARDLYQRGADVVFHAAGDSGDRIPQVADEMSDELGRHLWVIGVDSDQWLAVGESEQQHVLTSMLKRFDRLMRTALDLYFAGDLRAGVVTLGLDDGIVGLSTSGDHLDPSVRARVDALTQAIASGAIVVPGWPSEPPSLLPESDVVVRVTMTNDQCLVEMPESLRLMHSIRVEFDNQSTDAGAATIGRGAFDGDILPLGSFVDFAVPAMAEGHNAGVIRVPEPSKFTLACRNVAVEQVGQWTGFEIPGP